MHRHLIAAGLVAVLSSALAITSSARADETEGVYIIYDSSNSMWAALPDGSRKYEAARTAMGALVGRDFGEREVALRVYGHRRKDDCSDSELVVPFSPPSDVSDAMITAMQSVRPTGRTPIDLSLRQALDDFGERNGSIILISDGVESCDADPCALVRAWRDKDIDIAVHVVGLGLKGKERAAMECIADAAGTPYRDAFSAGELVDSLEAALDSPSAGEKPEPGTAVADTDESGPEFALIVETDDGVRQRGLGVLRSSSSEALDVETFARFEPVPGDYTLSAGVRLVDGEVYKPVTTEVTVAETGRTEGRVIAPRPPEVSATFSMEGEDLRSAVVTVYRDGKKLGSFKGDESAFVPEGSLEFRAQPPGTSAPMKVIETFVAGDSKVISFEAAIEVHLNVIARGTANGVRIGGRPTTELWQHGARVHKINRGSGGLVTPGTYVLHIDDNLNVFETEIVVTRDPKQVIELDVPAGGLTVRYQDVEGNELPRERIFVTPEGKDRHQVRSSNEPLVLMPGHYTITGWPKTAGYSDQEVNVQAGVDQTVILHATQ